MPTARPSSIVRRYGVHTTQVLGISPPVKVLTELGFAVAKYVLPSKSVIESGWRTFEWPTLLFVPILKGPGSAPPASSALSMGDSDPRHNLCVS
jgi:hypothetical protein